MANLIDLEDYKDAKSIANTKDDTRLNLLISSVSQLVKTYCGNSIVDYYSSEVTETINVTWDTHVIQLTEGPVVSITTVKERDSYSGAYKTLTTGAFEYYLDTTTDSLLRTTGSNNFCNWRKGPGAVEVAYKAGYASCPEDLKLAVIDLVTYYFKDEHKARQTMAGASICNSGSTSQRNSVGFPDHIKRVLDLYKNF